MDNKRKQGATIRDDGREAGDGPQHCTQHSSHSVTGVVAGVGVGSQCWLMFALSTYHKLSRWGEVWRPAVSVTRLLYKGIYSILAYAITHLLRYTHRVTTLLLLQTFNV